MKQVNAYGKVDNLGQLTFAGWRQVCAELKEMAGRPVTITITGLSQEPCQRFIGYYVGVVLPRIYRAFYELGHRYSARDIQQRLLKICPLTEHLTPEQLGEIDRETWIFYLEDLRVYAGENLHLILEHSQIINNL